MYFLYHCNSCVRNKAFTYLLFTTYLLTNQWREAVLVNIDKGKKGKEKLENKRGISLSNSISKVFEKIIVRRVHNEICFTEAQAGGRPNRSTIDHIFTLKSVIQQRFYEKKQTYVAFIDLEKAYDQAWKDAVLYTLWNRGIKGKIWRVIYELNSNQKIKIQTKFGLTDEVIVNDSLRQGKPLSGPELACFIDDLNWQTKMLQVIDNFLSKLQLKVNQNKSGIIVFNEKYNVNRKEENLKINIGNKVLESKNSYKYLGEIITPNLKVATCSIPDWELITRINTDKLCIWFIYNLHGCLEMKMKKIESESESTNYMSNQDGRPTRQDGRCGHWI